jgi:hypothetical protein
LLAHGRRVAGAAAALASSSRRLALLSFSFTAGVVSNLGEVATWKVSESQLSSPLPLLHVSLSCSLSPLESSLGLEERPFSVDAMRCDATRRDELIMNDRAHAYILKREVGQSRLATMLFRV